MSNTWRGLLVLVAGSLLVGLTAPNLCAQVAGRYPGLAPDAFMRSWRVLGPIPIAEDGSTAPDEAAQKQAFAVDYLAACGGEAGLRFPPERACTVRGREYRFVPFESERDLVDIGAAVGLKDYSVAYLAAVVEPAAAQGVLAALGSDDAVKVWLNGTLVHDNWILRAAALDQDLVRLDLRAGANTLLVKVHNAAGEWAFAARVLSATAAQQKLWDAARDDELAAIRTILASVPGVDLDAEARWRLTAWQAARLFGSADAAALLEEKGADTRRPLAKPETVVDAMLAAATEGRTPGAAVLVSRNGQVAFEKGYGYASLELGVKVTPKTKFRIGSITKQFTAAGILRLQELGKLSVEDPLSKYRPDFPRGAEVTLRQLLTHTSGIHSYTDKPDLPRVSMLPTTTEEHIRSFQGDPYDFDPGTRWSYSNSGYFLLGAIIEKVSGRSYADFLREQLFEPLGMKHTGVHTADAILDDAATGYAQQGPVLRRAPDWNMSVAGAAGALYSTVEDLARWNDAVFGGKVLSEASLAAAFAPVQVGASPPGGEGYGYGWSIGRLRGVREIGHGGGLPGFVSHLVRYPDDQLTVAVLVNSAPTPPALDPGQIGRAVAQLYLADRMEPRRHPVAVSLPPEALERFVGRYDYGNAVLTVTREGDRLFAQLGGQPRFEIFPSSQTEFAWKVVPAKITFVKDATGKVTGGIHEQGGRRLEVPRIE